jgi:uncharacterized protein
MLTADQVLAALSLKPLPLEGGYFRETYRSQERLSTGGRDRSLATAIYYLLTPDTFSAMHRLPSDEVFHFYAGGAVTMLQLGADGGRLVTIGTDLAAGEQPQLPVPGGVWQGSFLQPGGAWALLGTTVAPGFDFSDYEPGDRLRLSADYPDFADLIRRLTRE